MPTKPKPTSSSALPKVRKVNLAFLGRINITYILFILLIIAAFLLGVLVTKVQYLEKGITTTQPTNINNEFAAGDSLPQQPTGPVDIETGELPPLGDENAEIAIVEFSDFECPFCQSIYSETLPKIKEEYIDTGKVKFYFRHFPLTSIHPNAQRAHEASECANDQGNFWGYHDILFDNQTEWSSLTGDAYDEKLTEYAETLGLNTDEFASCVTSEKHKDKVNQDLEDGAAAGVDGTPGTFVDGYLVVGAVPFEEFKAQIDARLEAN